MSESSSQGEKPQIEIVTDEDWKSRVKAEDAKLDAAAQASDKTPVESDVFEEEDEPDFDPAALPSASLITLLQMLSSQSIVAMGLIPSPNGKTTVQLPIAKHFIDLLGVLDSKCKGNLTADEQRFLDGTLHELRMAYVDVSRKQS